MNEEKEVLNIEESEPLSALQRIYKIFISPTEVFRSINIKPNFWLPIILVVVFTLGFYFAFFDEFKDLMLEAAEQQVANSPNAPPEGMLEKTINFTAIAIVASSPLVIVIGMLLGALYYWVFGMILKGKGGYLKHFSLMANVSVVTILSVVVAGILAVFTGEYNIQEPVTSLASLLPESMNMTPLYGMLLKFEVFNIWRLVLVYLGIIEIGGLSKKKALIIVGTAFLFGVLYTGGSLWVSTLMRPTM